MNEQDWKALEALYIKLTERLEKVIGEHVWKDQLTIVWDEKCIEVDMGTISYGCCSEDDVRYISFSEVSDDI